MPVVEPQGRTEHQWSSIGFVAKGGKVRYRCVACGLSGTEREIRRDINPNCTGGRIWCDA